ncbi:TIGR04282 family arsenosugar biosynthesis glycosyltransferase [Paraoerskovia marina]|uniref:TIGR04282 family arsenosugar biosynthesis glycosyltransferase n=1 Tax=Paraoerskovia marina TaxID=545619 RepID=UPI000693A5E9|nr:TIGR04282 family arsenosugar biosynthesis glycosyltransferase [Paraoerskovia marina]
MSAVEPVRTIVVLAKAPEPGRVKTRLHGEFTPEQAADLARAALEDTLDAVAAVPDVARVLVLDGEAGPWVPEGFHVIPQVEGGLDRRLAGAFAETAYEFEGPILLVGMDTPQLAPYLDVDMARHDAALGLAEDGGFWAIVLPKGLKDFYTSLFHGVPMSEPTTGAAQLERMREFGLRVQILPTLRDVDDPDDASSVARSAPGSLFAAAWAEASGADSPSGLRERALTTPPGEMLP